MLTSLKIDVNLGYEVKAMNEQVSFWDTWPKVSWHIFVFFSQNYCLFIGSRLVLIEGTFTLNHQRGSLLKQLWWSYWSLYNVAVM